MCKSISRRGVVKIDGVKERLQLNFGAISYLENKLEVSSLSELISKFSEGNYSANDIILVLEAGFYGANKRYLNFHEVLVDGGVKVAAAAAVCLLKLAFEGIDDGS